MPETSVGATAARPVVQVGGSALPERVAAALRSATIETDVDGPDSCRLRFDDPGRDLLSGSSLDLAAELEVVAARVGDETGDVIFDGIVFAVGFEYDERGAWTTVSAYDRSYPLHTGVRTHVYQDVTDSDIAAQVAREAGLQAGTIDSTDVVHEHVAQVNETFAEFLGRRAREVDRLVRVRGRTLDFVRRTSADDAPDPGDLESAGRLQLVAGGNVQQLLVRVSAAQQVTEVQVRGWDPTTKETVVSSVEPRTRTADVQDTPASLARRLGGTRQVAVRVPLSQQAECDALAEAKAEHLAGAHLHAEGVAYGDPRIVAGTAVSLGATGGRFDGGVTITRATHTWDARGYRTAFVASGGHDRSVLGLLGQEPIRTRQGRVDGLVTGIVTNVSDPDGLARVKVRFGWLDDEYESAWSRPLQLGAGPGRGLQLLPEVDDEVLVGFDHGDPRRAYVLGGLFNGIDTPPNAEAVDSGSGEVTARLWRSRNGHELVLDDAAGGGGVVVRTADDSATITLDADTGAVTVRSTGDVTVAAEGSLSITADGDLALESAKAGSFTAGGDLTLRGSNVVVKGTTIKLN